MTKSTRARYTLEFKEEAVRLVTGGERVATVARNLGLSEQTLHNWVKAAGNGGLKSSATPAVSAEQMEISRLRTELSRVKMECDILKNHRGPPSARSSPGPAARLGFPIHPHILRHATGYKLANDGRDARSIQHYLGHHRNIQHTARYTQLAPDRFKDFWMD